MFSKFTKILYIFLFHCSGRSQAESETYERPEGRAWDSSGSKYYEFLFQEE